MKEEVKDLRYEFLKSLFKSDEDMDSFVIIAGTKSGSIFSVVDGNYFKVSGLMDFVKENSFLDAREQFIKSKEAALKKQSKKEPK